MKKLAKILLAVLVVATLLGVMAFAVAADDTTEATIWTPEKNSGIKWAVWANEAAYLEGGEAGAPMQTFTTDIIYPVAGAGYYHVYADAKFGPNAEATAAGAFNVLGPSTINFGGKTITMSGDFNVNKGSTTFKNGTLTMSARFRPGDNVNNNVHLFENLRVIASSRDFTYGGAFKEWTFKDCYFELNSNFTSDHGFFHINPYLLSSGYRFMVFKNSTINVKGASTDKGLFEVWTQPGSVTNCGVFFDKDSAIIGNVTKLITLTKMSNIEFAQPILFYFEEGFEIDPLAIDSIEDNGYYIRSGHTSTSQTHAGDIKLWSAEGDEDKWNEDLQTSLVRAYLVREVEGETDFTKWTKLPWLDSTERTLAVGHNAGYILSEFTEDDVTFKIYDSAEKNTLLYSGTRELSPAVISLAGSCYVELCRNVKIIDKDGVTGTVCQIGAANKVITLNLNNKTLSPVKAGFKIVDNCTLKMQNGTFDATGVGGFQMFAGFGAQWYMDGVDYRATILGYFLTLDKLEVKNSTLSLSGSSPISFASHKGDEADIDFINTQIICTSQYVAYQAATNASYNQSTGIITFFQNDNSKQNNWNVTFDGQSSISCTYVKSKPNWVAFIGCTAETMANGPFVTLEEGFSTDLKNVPDFTYLDTKAGAFYTRNDAIFTLVDKDGNAIENTYLLDTDNVISYYYSGNKSVEVYALKKNDGNPSLGSDLQANLTLTTNFDINFFANPERVTGIYLDCAALAINEEANEADRNVYTVSVPVVAVADELDLYLALAVDGETRLYPATYSVKTYVKQILDGNYSDASKTLVKSAMEYAKAAYAYANEGAALDLGFDTTVEAKNLTPVAPNLGDVTAVTGARLELGSSVKYRFTLGAGYNGYVTINGTSYEVVDGKFLGEAYIEVELRAYELANDVKIVDNDGNVAYYSLVNYANNEQVTGALEELVNALYTYCVYASDYRISNPNRD